MKYFVAIGLFATLGLVGCSSAFKTAGTPDDVYYSYGTDRPAAEEKYREEESSTYTSYFDNADDRYLRMKVQDRARWSTIDDVNYWYGYNNPNTMWNMNWNVGFNSWNFNNPWAWNNAFMWNNPWAFNNFYNSWNNPWCWNRPIVVVSKFPAGSGNANFMAPRPGLSRGGYTNSIFDRGEYNRTGNGKSSTPQAAGYGTRELFRSVFGTGSDGSSQGYSRPSRLFSNSNSGSSTGSMFSGGSSGGSSRTSGGGGSSSGSSSSGSSSSGGSRGGRGGN